MTMVDYGPRPKAIVYRVIRVTEGQWFDYSPNSHEITVLLPNNNIYTRYHEDSISSDSPYQFKIKLDF